MQPLFLGVLPRENQRILRLIVRAVRLACPSGLRRIMSTEPSGNPGELVALQFSFAKDEAVGSGVTAYAYAEPK